MGLEMKPGSQWWYGQYRENGKLRQFRLETPIEGVRPAKLTGVGDRVFERSRGAALKEFRDTLKSLRGDPMAEKAVQRLVEIKTGRVAEFPKVADLPALWDALPRRREPDARYAEQCKGVLRRFAEYLAVRTPPVVEFVKVTPDTARAFMDAEAARGLAPKTWNDTLKLLRTIFKRVHPQLNDGSNPFHGLITKATETVNRDPFPIPVLKAILDLSKEDPFIRPIIVTGICTAMRRGDCCLMKWDDVDLEEGYITVKTSKTGETVDVPMFPMLKDLLRAAVAKQAEDGQKSVYCFPDAAAMYEKNPDGITWRVKQVLAASFRRHAAEAGKAFPEVPADEVRRRGLAYLETLDGSKRNRHMREIFDLYMAGKDINEVMVGTGLSRGSVSGLLNDIEQHIKCVLVRGKVRGTVAELLQEGRGENGDRRASVYDFHSFRVTWITLALAAGVPLELVQRVTGHRTVEIVLKHYFRPGRDDFRETIMSAMPELLTAPTAAPALPAASGTLVEIIGAGGQQEPAGAGDVLEEALKALEAMNAKNWRKQRDVAAGHIRKVKGFVEERYSVEGGQDE